MVSSEWVLEPDALVYDTVNKRRKALDLNSNPISPSTLNFDEIETGANKELCELEKTAEIGKMVGVQIEATNVILQEVMGEGGENEVFQ